MRRIVVFFVIEYVHNGEWTQVRQSRFDNRLGYSIGIRGPAEDTKDITPVEIKPHFFKIMSSGNMRVDGLCSNKSPYAKGQVICDPALEMHVTDEEIERLGGLKGISSHFAERVSSTDDVRIHGIRLYGEIDGRIQWEHADCPKAA